MLSNIYDIIKDKIFWSNISGEKCIVVEKVPEIGNDGKAYFDGMRLIDNVAGIEDDIQQVSSMTIDGKHVNLEDYYTENGAFEDGEEEQFRAALKRLMPADVKTVAHFREFLHLMSTKGFGDLPVVVVHEDYPWPINRVRLSEDGTEMILSYDFSSDFEDGEYEEYLSAYDLLDILDEDDTSKLSVVIVDDRGDTDTIIKHELSGEWRDDELKPLYDKVVLLF